MGAAVPGFAEHVVTAADTNLQHIQRQGTELAPAVASGVRRDGVSGLSTQHVAETIALGRLRHAADRG
jgi:hypothetical protein